MFPTTQTAERRRQPGEPPPSIADIIREETDDGRIIVRFLIDVLEGDLEGATLAQKRGAALQLQRFGYDEAQAFLDANPPAPRKPRSNPPPARKPSRALPSLQEHIRQETGDGRDVVRFLVGVMQGNIPGFKPQQRMDAARQLLTHLTDNENHHRPNGTGPIRGDRSRSTGAEDRGADSDSETAGTGPASGPAASDPSDHAGLDLDEPLADEPPHIPIHGFLLPFAPAEYVESRERDERFPLPPNFLHCGSPHDRGCMWRLAPTEARRIGSCYCPHDQDKCSFEKALQRLDEPLQLPDEYLRCDCEHENLCLYRVDPRLADRMSGCLCTHDDDTCAVLIEEAEQDRLTAKDRVPFAADLPPPEPGLFETSRDPNEPSVWELKAVRKNQDLRWDSPYDYASPGHTDSLRPP